MRVLVLGKTLHAETHVICFSRTACAPVRLTVSFLHNLVPYSGNFQVAEFESLHCGYDRTEFQC